MKRLTNVCFLASLLLPSLFLSAQRPTAVSRVDVAKTNGISIGRIQGAYTMLRQVLNNGAMDSVMDNEQLKIYTDRYMMYAHRINGDSLAAYGIGTYGIENGKLIEYIFYTNYGARKDTVELLIKKSGDGYTQVINYPEDSLGVKYVLTEDYATVSKELSSPLDGVWKQTKTSFIPTNGTATTNNNPTQFKVFQSGHFIWANTSKDSATQKPVSFFGYGTFEMKGKNQVIEHNTHSTFTQGVVGTPITLQIAFAGKDAYTQTINWPDGRSVEVYQRMK